MRSLPGTRGGRFGNVWRCGSGDAWLSALPRLLLVCGVLLSLAGSTAKALPDGRAYEQVTPVDKKGGDVGGPADGGLFASALGQSSTAGDAITYVSLTSFGDARSAELTTQYISTRGTDSWVTEAISPPAAVSGTLNLSLSPFHFFTGDLSTGLLDWRQPTLTEEAPQGFDNLYVRDADGTYRLVTNVAPPTVQPENYSVTFAGASPDLSHVVFEANDALTGGAPAGARSLYEWTGSALRLVSVLPGSGGVAATSAGAGDGNDDNFANVVSSDGSRIFWTDGEGQLYVREDATRTAKLNTSRRAVSLGDGSATLRAATPDGSKAIFTDETPLTDEPNDNGGIYEYNLESESLSDLTPSGGDPGVQGVLGMSEDGSTLYFVASAVLASGASAGSENLYVARGGAIEFIATLIGEDSTDWTQSFKERTARVTPDGAHVAFLSEASLTGYNNVDVITGNHDSELFVYDAHERRLTCVSCNPGGTRPVGPASIPVGTDPSYQPRILSDDGKHVFFDSKDALVSADTNGQQDVYEYEDGTVYLISAGTSSDISTLVDTSDEGHDVFFTTRSQLVAPDDDESSDIYDARVGGGFPVATGTLPCAGEACRGPLSAPPVPLTPVTALFTGEEGPPPPAVSKPMVKRRRTPATKVKRSKGNRGKRLARAKGKGKGEKVGARRATKTAGIVEKAAGRGRA